MRALCVGCWLLSALGCAENPRRARVEPPAEALANRALNLTFGGSARVELESVPPGGDFTLVARFLPAHRATYRGAVLSDATGRFQVGVAPFSSLGVQALELRLGETTTTWPFEDSAADEQPAQPTRWHHLAVSFGPDLVSVFLDGRVLGTIAAAGEWPLFEGLMLGGTGRAGRSSGHGSAESSEPMAAQFYGLIDDVGVVERTLSPNEIRALAASARPPTETGGSVTWCDFDQNRGPRAERCSLLGAARTVEVSRERDAAADRKLVAEPSHVTGLSLPFAAGEVWRVVQGIDSARSHHDEAAFAVDFARVETNPQRAGREIVRAAADGIVVARVDCFPDHNRAPCPRAAYPARLSAPAAAGSAANRNLVCLRHAPAEYSCYLHLRQGSVSVALGERVVRGAPLAAVGSSGTRSPHLHFALSDLPEPDAPGSFGNLVTRPFVFDDYLTSNDEGVTWLRVPRGVPKRGQWVKSELGGGERGLAR